jgi:hypothetical protein
LLKFKTPFILIQKQLLSLIYIKILKSSPVVRGKTINVTRDTSGFRRKNKYLRILNNKRGCGLIFSFFKTEVFNQRKHTGAVALKSLKSLTTISLTGPGASSLKGIPE